MDDLALMRMTGNDWVVDGTRRHDLGGLLIQFWGWIAFVGAPQTAIVVALRHRRDVIAGLSSVGLEATASKGITSGFLACSGVEVSAAWCFGSCILAQSCVFIPLAVHLCLASIVTEEAIAGDNGALSMARERTRLVFASGGLGAHILVK